MQIICTNRNTSGVCVGPLSSSSAPSPASWKKKQTDASIPWKTHEQIGHWPFFCASAWHGSHSFLRRRHIGPSNNPLLSTWGMWLFFFNVFLTSHACWALVFRVGVGQRRASLNCWTISNLFWLWKVTADRKISCLEHEPVVYEVPVAKESRVGFVPANETVSYLSLPRLSGSLTLIQAVGLIY